MKLARNALRRCRVHPGALWFVESWRVPASKAGSRRIGSSVMKLFSVLARILFPRLWIVPPSPTHAHAHKDAVIPGNIGRRVKRTVLSSTDATYNVVASDEYVVAVANKNIILPKASTVPEGWMVFIANAAPGSLTVAIAPVTGDTIAGVSGGLSMTSVGMLPFVSDGVDNWESVDVPSVEIL